MRAERTDHHPGGRIVVAEDEKPLAQMVATYLSRDGFHVEQAHTGVQALDSVRAEEPDVLILDLGLPGLDGIEVCRRVRAMSECYVLILTAGADDYITKPFSVRELVARVHAVLRRPRTGNPPQDSVRDVGDLTIDLAGHEIRRAGAVIPLTRTEFDLLVALSAAPNRALSRRQLIDAVWDTSWVGDERIVDVHIGHLRRKLGEEPDGGGLIETVRGVGYRMVLR
jgi:DNA-binding response OmpR family regulator